MINLDFLPKNLIEGCELIGTGEFQYVASAMTTSLSDVLCYVVDEKYLEIALNNKCVSFIIVRASLLGKKYSEYVHKSFLLSSDPEATFRQINNFLFEEGMLNFDYPFTISNSAIVGDGTQIGRDVYIADNVSIGKNCLICDNTFIHEGCNIGDNVTLGNEGLYFKRDKDGLLHRVYSSGGVVIEKNVEILNGSSIQKSHDLGLFTTIGQGTKISVNVNVGHSVLIGEHTLISGNVQIAGRAKIGSYCWIGTSTTISDSVIVGDHSLIRIGSVVVQNVKDKEDVSGNFAYSHRVRLKNHHKLKKGL